MTEYEITETGQKCPMPVVKTKQHIDRIAAGEILEVLVIDPGSMSDLGNRADTTGEVELLDQQEGDESTSTTSGRRSKR